MGIAQVFDFRKKFIVLPCKVNHLLAIEYLLYVRRNLLDQ